MKLEVLCYDAFTDKSGKGNPAGVCFDCDDWSEEKMQSIAKQVGYSETAFLLTPDNPEADYRFRYFTPGHEVDLCGHATIATTIALAERMNLQESKNLRIETKAGLLEIVYDAEKNEVIMEQANAKFELYEGSAKELLDTIELPEEVLDNRYPIVYGNTGIWTCVIPIKSLDYFKQMVPHNDEFQYVLKKHPFASIHLFCEDTINEDCLLHARHFSGSGMGSIEDPVTGTASGVMGAYYIKYMHPELNETEFLIEQGQDMGKDGFCRAFAKKHKDGEISVKIAGTGTYLTKMVVEVKA